ncbi:hypothetical protein F8S12_21490 [Nostoc sp. WHI]|nr:hypothetical protein [Nostoc sp. WHI]
MAFSGWGVVVIPQIIKIFNSFSPVY